VSASHDDISTGAIVAFTIALCPDPECVPSEYKLCADCNAILDDTYPDKCPDPNCYPCTRGAAEAARAEQ
jgi:hypothetical protein